MASATTSFCRADRKTVAPQGRTSRIGPRPVPRRARDMGQPESRSGGRAVTRGTLSPRSQNAGSESSPKRLPSKTLSRQTGGSRSRHGQQPVQTWPGCIGEVRAALNALPHPSVREQVLEQLRAHGFGLVQCEGVPAARAALLEVLTRTEDALEYAAIDHPRRALSSDRAALRSIRRNVERRMHP